ncbi:MAG: 50S ribosomal protein L15 [Actinomycetota bacterium]|nr:50S ribosomal protein L15 [Actinomycetota bacterium]
MKLHELRPAEGSIKSRKRVGRGRGSGCGKTSGRGTKGQKARSGGSIRPGFEGGQNPLHLRLPKLPGFRNLFKREYAIVNVENLNVFKDKSVIDPKALLERGLIRKRNLPVKILGEGKLSKALTVRAHSFSKTAVKKIEEAGGKAEVVQ